MLLAEELLLLALDDEKGTGHPTGAEEGLAGALLVELALVGVIEERGDHLAVTGGGRPEGLLGEALSVIADSPKPRKTVGWVTRLVKDLKPLRQRIADGLCRQGILEEDRHKLLGIPLSTRYPERDPGPERDLRDRLRSVLLDERAPDAREAALAGLLPPFDLDKKLVEKDQRKDARRRAQELAEGSVASEAVAQAVRAVQTAVLVAIVAASTASANAVASS